MANKISSKNITLAIQSGTERTLFAKWVWSKDKTKEYNVQWDYATGDGVWFDGSNSTVTTKNALYNIPTNATKVRFRVKPVSKIHKVNKKDTSYWTASWSSWIVYKVKLEVDHTPATPAVPSISITNYKLTAEIDCYDDNTKFCQFELVKNDKVSVRKQIVKKVKNHLSCTFSVSSGNEYKVRVRGGYTNQKITKEDNGWTVTTNIKATTVSVGMGVLGPPIALFKDINDIHVLLDFGEWSNYSSACATKPSGVGTIECSALTETSVKIRWSLVPIGITSYEIEYTTNKDFFDSNPSGVSKHTPELSAKFAIITGLETGTVYYFRMRAVNSSGVSEWSDISSVILGTVPNPPTTWSSSTTAILGEDITLYWMHNSTDGSTETAAEVNLEIVTNVGNIKTLNVGPPRSGSTVNETIIKTNGFTRDTRITWSVRTKGVLPTFSEYSIARTINVYQPPIAYLNIYKTNKWWWDLFNFEKDSIYTALGDFADPYGTDEIIKRYPIFIVATTEPNSQKPIAAYFSIFALESYEEIGPTGEGKMVNANDEIFSQTADMSRMLEVTVGYQIPLVLLPNNIYLEDGIEYKCVFTVAMDNGLSTQAECTFRVELADDEYDLDAEIGYDNYTVSTSITPRCVTSRGVDDEGEYDLVNGIRLSLYRRDFDGQFIELIRNVDNLRQTTVTDPHPTLGYARYRIVATDNTTGKIFFTDLPAYPIPERAIILQWDQKWQDFDVKNPDEMVEPVFSGSFLRLPYNISVSDSTDPNVELVKYIGREHPVTYYGTQVGQTSSWSFDIVRDDIETLYALRRLSRYMGDVYVREPNGSGYWANIKINWNIANKAVIIPVSLKVTRVEGGV